MSRILTCTWAPTALAGMRLAGGPRRLRRVVSQSGPPLAHELLAPVLEAEQLGVDYLLVAQRWWGSGEEIEGSSYDCLAMTSFYAARTERIGLITAVHPGFFLPAPIAKWGATLDRLTGGRWAINVTSGWHEREFGMFGAELLSHDDRYARATEFIEVLRGAWEHERFDYEGRYYQVRGLRLEPRPYAPLTVFQGGQSAAAQAMVARHADWQFLNGGPPDKIAGLIDAVRVRAAALGRTVRFALYAIPLVRETDAAAEAEIARMVAAVDPAVVARRRDAVGGARGMWAPSADPLTMLDSNEGYAARLIGSPETVLRRMLEFHALGVDLFHLALVDARFTREVLPALQRARHQHSEPPAGNATAAARTTR